VVISVAFLARVISLLAGVQVSGAIVRFGSEQSTAQIGEVMVKYKFKYGSAFWVLIIFQTYFLWKISDQIEQTVASVCREKEWGK
jgi:hypothetical protein